MAAAGELAARGERRCGAGIIPATHELDSSSAQRGSDVEARDADAD